MIPKDGVQRRLHVLLGKDEQNKLHMVLETDRFAASQPIVLKEDFSEVRFRLESDNPASHVARLRLSEERCGELFKPHRRVSSARLSGATLSR